MRVAVLSPHRDDAAFSGGLTLVALLRAGATVTVVNVFTQSDYAVDLGTVPASDPSVDAVSAARLREDLAFIAAVTAAAGAANDAVCLRDFRHLDAPLRLTIPTEDVLLSPLSRAEAAAQAERLAGDLGFLAEFDLVAAPLALGDHIDHRIVRDAAVRCVPATQLCLYEDLPYAARMHPAARQDTTCATLRDIFQKQFECFATCEPDGAHLKYSFAMQYPTQIAPDVAAEMARYGAAGQTAGAAVEHWFARAACVDRLADFLRASGVVLQRSGEL